MASNSYIFSVPMSAVRAVLLAAGHQDIRARLNSVLFDFTADDLNLVATDGHRLHAMRVIAQYEDKAAPVPKGLKVLIPAQALRGIKVAKRDIDMLTVALTLPKSGPPDIVLTFMNTSHQCVGFDEQYPDYWRVLQQRGYCTGNPSLQLFPKYLADAEAALILLGGKNAITGMTLLTAPADDNSRSDAIVLFPDYPDFIALIMPYRPTDATLPAWLTRRDEKLKKAA